MEVLGYRTKDVTSSTSAISASKPEYVERSQFSNHFLSFIGKPFYCVETEIYICERLELSRCIISEPVPTAEDNVRNSLALFVKKRRGAKVTDRSRAPLPRPFSSKYFSLQC